MLYTYVPVCTAQGDGGSFKEANYRRLVAVNHASQTTDGSKKWLEAAQCSCSCSCNCSCDVIVVGVVVVVQ